MTALSNALRETTSGWVLVGERERATGRVRFPAATGDDEWEPVELATRGELFTWSTVRMAAAHFDPPYDVGYVRLPEGVLVFAPLRVPDGVEPRIGHPVHLEVVPGWPDGDVEDAPPVSIYRFVLTGGEDR